MYIFVIISYTLLHLKGARFYGTSYINRKSTSFSHPRKNTQVFFPVTALHFIFLTAAGRHTSCIFPFRKESFSAQKTDWYCQHVTLVDTMRRQFYATGDLFPDWISLGSGTNFYALSYYGFLRPDVLVSYLSSFCSCGNCNSVLCGNTNGCRRLPFLLVAFS